MRKQCQEFISNSAGGIAVFFAIGLPLLILAIGVAIDYSRVEAAHNKLNNYADVAALSSAKAGADQLLVSARQKGWKLLAKEVGTNYFDQSSSMVPDMSDIKATIKLTDMGTQIQSHISYTANYNTIFMQIFGMPTITVAGTSTASIQKQKYTRINFVVDVSASMGIGATPSAQDDLVKATGCAIACHYDDIWVSRNTLPQVRALNIELRIDIVKNAIDKMLQNIKTDSAIAGQFEIAIYTFSSSPVEFLAPTTDIDKAIAAAADLEMTNVMGQGGTNIQHSMRTLAKMMAAGGNGTNIFNREAFTLVFTDGVENSVMPIAANSAPPPKITYTYDVNFNHNKPDNLAPNGIEYIQGFDPLSCTAVKNIGHTLMVLNLEYQIPTSGLQANDNRFPFIENTLKPAIITNAQICASSPSLAFTADTPAEIDRAATRIYDEVIKSNLRITH